MQYPKYRVGKDIQIKLAPQVGVMSCDFKHLTRTFGNPLFSTDYGDDFDGVEKCAWHIQFQTGDVARICDVRPFGSNDLDYKAVQEWRVNSHNPVVYEWIKQIIRDANPKQRQ